jgi:hypothetical protein
MLLRKLAPGAALVALTLAWAAVPPFVSADQTTAVPIPAVQKAAGVEVTNYILRLPDAYIVYEPSGDIFQIASLGTVLSYGRGWERRQVKPYLFHIRHQSWKNYFWKVNTSRREVYLVWGGLFGRIGSGTGAGPAREVEGDREDITVDVIGGAQDQVPQRFFIRLAGADLYFDPLARDLRLAAAGLTFSPGDDWEACVLNDYLFHIRLKTWKGFFWKVNTSRMAAWRTMGADFCKLGGEDKELSLTLKSFRKPFSMARLKTALAEAEKAKLRDIAEMIEAGRPIAEINKASADFVRESPGIDPELSVEEISKEIKAAKDLMEKAKNKRQEYETAFENIDQKTAQLFNLLSAVMKNIKENQEAIIRNLL